MTKKAKKDASRPPIPEPVRIQVWSEAAGRCQFRGCNKPLWYNGLTLNEGNFSQMAHIIGASVKGPRGNDRSHELAQDPANIILMCAADHKEIDARITRGLYSVDELIQMKKEHSDRVRLLLDQPSKSSLLLILKSKIEGQQSAFAQRAIQNALLPDYPDRHSHEWMRIELDRFDRSDLTQWDIARKWINEEVNRINRECQNNSISQLSVFALAAQPLLMYLGRQLGDKIPAQIFEPRRSEDQDNQWKWDEEDGITRAYHSEKIATGNGNDVLLLLALSDHLGKDKYDKMLESPHVYQLTIDNPVQGFLTKRSEKAAFIQSCRSLLNLVQYEVGKDCNVHVLPAMPASLAVEFGRLIQPTKDPKITVYENVDNTIPRQILDLN